MPPLRKRRAPALLLALLVLLSGCALASPPEGKELVGPLAAAKYPERPGLGIRLESNAYLVGTEWLPCTWFNRTGEEMTFGAPFAVEKQIDGSWYAMGPQLNFELWGRGVGLAGVAYRYSISHLNLNAGKYRIAATAHSDSGTYQMYAYFSLKTGLL